MKFRQNRIKGFTLAELIVNLAVMVIVVIISGSMIISGMNIFFRNAEVLQQKNIADAVSNLISEKLMYAKSISANENDAFSAMFNLSENGQLIIKYADEENEINAFGEEFYNFYSISYLIKINDGSATVTVDIYDDENEIVYTKESGVILINKPETDSEWFENTELYIE